jgi:excisionase family DNA binding protein
LEGYLTTEETATALGTTKQNVHKMIRDGRLANVRFIGTGKPILLIPTAEVDDRSLRAARDDRELRDDVYGDDD